MKKILDKEIVWNCHSGAGTHEVGCPHKKWTEEDLRAALELKKRFEQSGLAGKVFTKKLAEELEVL